MRNKEMLRQFPDSVYIHSKILRYTKENEEKQRKKMWE